MKFAEFFSFFVVTDVCNRYFNERHLAPGYGEYVRPNIAKGLF